MFIIHNGMRYSAQHKTKTHERVLKKAAEQMCRRGVQGTGIASLMGKVGLTHGGFYAHFPDKNALIAEAMVPMLEQGVAGDVADRRQRRHVCHDVLQPRLRPRRQDRG